MKDPLFASSFNDYDILKQIGKGAYGIVYKVRHRADKSVYALKTIDISKLDNKALSNTLNEIRILCSISHPNVVGYKEAFLNGSTLCVVMEYVGGGDLSEKIASCRKRNYCINEESIWKYTVQILNGLKELHGLKILHRDIKSANIFLSEDFETVKLGDLNIAKVAKEDFASTQIGTPYYLAPEIWMNQKYDYRCDVFSLGCVVYEMATLRVPFDASTIQELYKKVTQGNPDPISGRYSNQLSEMIRLFLIKNPANRPTVFEAMEIPVIKAKLSKYVESDFKFENSKVNALLDTIRVPQNLNLLKNRLPKRKLTDYELKSYRKNSRESTGDTYSKPRSAIDNRFTVQSTQTKQRSSLLKNNPNNVDIGKHLLEKIKLNLHSYTPGKKSSCNSSKSQLCDRKSANKCLKPIPVRSPYSEYIRCNSLNSRTAHKNSQISCKSLAR